MKWQIIVLLIILFASHFVSAGRVYINNVGLFRVVDDDLEYHDLTSMTSKGFLFKYFQGGVVDSTILYGVKRSVDRSYEAYVEFPQRECYSNVVYEFRAKYNGSGRNTVRWIILVVKEQGYKFNYGVGYDITFYHSPRNEVYIFKADGGLDTVWSASAPQLTNNEWHVYRVEFDNYTIKVYVDGHFVGSYTDVEKSYPLCGGVAIMYEQTEGELYLDWLRMYPKPVELNYLIMKGVEIR